MNLPVRRQGYSSSLVWEFSHIENIFVIFSLFCRFEIRLNCFSLDNQDMSQESEIDPEDELLSKKTSSLTINQIEENKENVTLIWFQSVQEKTKENLRVVNNLVLCPETIERCIMEIESRKEDRIFLISERSNINQLLPKIKDLHQLDSVFIYPENAEELNGVKVDSTKIVGSFKNGETLIESIRQNTKRVDKEMEMTSFYDHAQRSTRNLSKESAEFLW